MTEPNPPPASEPATPPPAPPTPIAPAYIYRATMRRIVDGDTFRLDVDLGLKTWVRDEEFRLYGVDVAERSTELGKQAIAFLHGVFPPNSVNPVIIQTIKDKDDKYGRMLAKVFVPLAPHYGDLAAWMISQGFGVEYFGGKRG